MQRPSFVLLLCTSLAAAGLARSDQSAPLVLPAPAEDSDYRPVDHAQAELGRLLFWDPVLSGNRNIACGTCHNPRFASGDGVSLGLGEGAVGLGPARTLTTTNIPLRRIGRNTPGLFNLGAAEFTALFQDGGVEEDPTRPSGLHTPVDDAALAGIDSVLAAQIMFPLLTPDEMAGQGDENEIATAVRRGIISGPDGALALIAARVNAIAAYRTLFAALPPGIRPAAAIAFPDIANAIAAFISVEYRSDTSPFDARLRKETPLDAAASRGMALFYGPAGCATCHSGAFQTDHGFHAMGAPQLGPGKAEAFEINSRDTGRMRVTRQEADAYAFRTPSLRNVIATGPWGHAGGHTDLAAFLAYHADPVAGLRAYQRQAILPVFQPDKPDWAVMESDAEKAAIARMITVKPVALTPDEIRDLIAFLGALTDQTALAGRMGIPDTVPSGLAIDRGD